MKKLLERLDKYVIVTNKEGEVYYCNHKLLNQLHRELNQIKGENIKSLLDEAWLDTEEISEFYTYLLIDQNKKQYVQVERVEEIWEGDSVYYFLIGDVDTARDITEEKLCEQEREAYKHKIEMDKIRNEFFRNMSHEFRTPINIILSGVQLIEKISSQEMISKEQLEGYLNKLKRNAFRLLKLANNLIDLTGMSVGSETLNLENHNIINIIEETTLSAVQYAKSKEITLIFDTEEEDVIMACDAEKIQCIVLNLLSNAIKYTPQKGQIEVNILRREDTIDLSVSDTGIGIPKEKREIIFEGGVQLDTSLRRISEGSGMGLAIVKGIVELCQGTVHVDSIEGEGSTFTVTLPIHILEGSESINEVESILKVERCNMEFSDLLVI